MKVMNVDVAIIGSGTAGMNAYRAARKHTNSIALIESGPYGTTCARVGCMPSKLLIAAAEAAHHARSAHVFGVHLARGIEVHGKEVMQRVRSERDRFVGFVVEDVESFEKQHKVIGKAEFATSRQLVVDGKLKIDFKSCVLAVGSRTRIPDVLSEVGEQVVTNEEVFYWQDLPESVAVMGPGVIGLELGQALHRLGVRVTIFGRSQRVGPLVHPELQKQAATIFGGELDLRLKTRIEKVRSHNGKAVIYYRDAGDELIEQAYEKILVTSGRLSNVDRLAIQKTGIAVNDQGIPLYDPYTGQCGDSAIFIAGDAMNEHMLLHEASDTGRIAGDNAARYPDIRVGLRRSPFSIVFSDPQMSMVGLNWNQVQALDHSVGHVSFANQGRSRVMNRNKGGLFVYAEHGTGRLLGAEMLGPAAEHLGHLLAWAHQHQMTVPHMLELPFYHPVVEEGLRTALRKVNAQLHFSGPPVKNCLDCGPGA